MRFRTLLAKRDFRCLWLGQMCSQLGDRTTQTALIAIAGLWFPGSASALARVMACTVVPAFLVGPFAGACVDRWDRRRTMMVCDVARAACVMALPAVLSGPSFLPACGVILALFAVACFFLPARLALLPSLVPPAGLVAANSLMTTSGMVGATVSFFVGGFLVEWIGVPASCGVVAASYAGSAAFVAAIRRRDAPLPTAARSAALLTEICEGFQYVLRRSHAQFAAGVLFLLTAAAGAAFVVATVLVQQIFGSVTRDVGVLGVALGIGLGGGAVVYGRLGQRWNKPILVGVCLVGIGLCLLGLTVGVGVWRSRAAGCVAAGLCGVCVAPIGIAVNAMIHELVHDRLRGRVFSAMGMVMNAGLLIGLGGAGTVAGRLTLRGTLLATAAVLVAIGIGVLLARPVAAASGSRTTAL